MLKATKLAISEQISIEEKLDAVFERALVSRGIHSEIIKYPDFPFKNFSETVVAVKLSRVDLSLGVINNVAFKAVANEYELNLFYHIMIVCIVISLISLIGGTIYTKNYFILVAALLWIPLSYFGTHPAYKKAPKFIMLVTLLTILAYFNEYIGSTSILIFVLFITTANYLVRRLYNSVIIDRAITIEKALMFLTGVGAITLCKLPSYEQIWPKQPL